MFLCNFKVIFDLFLGHYGASLAYISHSGDFFAYLFISSTEFLHDVEHTYRGPHIACAL